MRQQKASLSEIGRKGAREAIKDWFDGCDGQILHVWKEVEQQYPTFKVVVATKRYIYFARFFPELNYQAEDEEDFISDNWNLSIDRKVKWETYEEIDNNIPNPERDEESV
jgi:hypothetical protein